MRVTRPEAARRAVYGGLDVIEVPGEPSASTVICLHGYGANAADLAPLAVDLKLGAPARWIFPDAPAELEYGGIFNSRAWFPIDMAELERAQRLGGHRDFAAFRPEGLTEARKAVRALIDALGVSWDKVIVGGFSQGSMVALDLCLHEQAPPQGLFLLSGNLVDEKNVRDRSKRLASMSFFQSHGKQDPVLSFEGARRLADVLREAGLKGELHPFDGGHALPPDIVMDLGRYLTSIQSPG